LKKENKNIVVKFTEDYDIKLINDILKIDSIVYPNQLQGTFDEVASRFRANQDMFILLYDDDKLIGYLCLFPIKEKLYEEIINNDKLFDSNISCELLEQYMPLNTYRLYLISAVIVPEYQGQGLSKYLINGFYKYLLDKKKQKILFSAALSTAVTDGGEVMLKKMSFNKRKTVSKGYALYELRIDDIYYEFIEGIIL
jgi:GNAT superfamily N-acetyltransferase